MEVYKYRIKRSNPSVYWTVPCTGGTNFYPINTSSNCSGLTMYNSTFSQVQNALQGDMNNFPTELTACSSSNPCILLNDTTTLPVYAAPPPYGNTPPIASPFCLDIESHPYVIFAGMNLFQAGVQTFTGESYNDLISVFALTNSTLSQPLNQQTNANLVPNTVSCFCPQPVFDDLYQIPVLLDQDFNDIGHYDIWDGNLGQKDIFSNFIVTATTALGNQIQVYNTTDFGYYKSYQDSPYTINWGDCPCNCPVPPCVNSFGDPCCETLQFPNLTNPVPHTYAGVGTRRITITHENQWGPTSVSQAITVPFMPYNTLQASGGIPASNAPVIGPNGPVGTNTYFGAYPFSPLDSGTDILQYSGMSPIFAGGNNSNCYEVTGNTQSLLGAFQTYTSQQTGNLPPGYQINVDVPIMGDVLNPLTNLMEQGVMGRITEENTQYTAYTISIGTNTPITFYDFSNGVTLYEATSCGLDAFAFGAFDCVKCEIADCTYCETKDEYIDRITNLPQSISFNPMINTNWGEWSATTNYVKGDIVFDSTWGECCCYMAVKDINQTGSTIDPWAGIKPTELVQGVWWFNGQPTEHIWEACTPECEACPEFTSIPCYDPTNTWNAYPTTTPVGPAGTYVNGSVYTTGQFTLGQFGNCYRALSGGTLPPPTGLTNNQYWDYIGCSSWVCPPVSALTAASVSCQLVPGTGSTSTGPCTTVGYTAYEDCMDDFYAGDCCEDRYICIDQYSCQGCSAMTSAHPLYNDPSALDPNQGPVFDNEMDCLAWCEPPAYSCVTSTPASSNNCCGLLSCAEDALNGTTFYVDNVFPAMTSLPPTPAPFLNFIDYAAFNLELFFDPYNINDCNAGFTNSAGTYTGCCDYTMWTYNCEEGCIPVFVGTGYTTEADCYAANPQWLGSGNTPCGYVCDPICDPCSPCYTLNCGFPYTPAGLQSCEMVCSCATECYVCDCLNVIAGSNVPCYPYQDPVTNALDCPYWPVSSTGLDPWVPAAWQGVPTFSSAQQCQSACTCPGGYDCFVYASGPQQGQQFGGCMYFASEYLMQQMNATWPLNSPTDPLGNPTGYTTFEECCNATECCRAVCEDDAAAAAYQGLTAGTTSGPALQGGGGGTIPCYWVSQTNIDNTNGTSSNCCSPAYVDNFGSPTGLIGCFADNPNLPYCDMIDCVNALCPDPTNTTGMTCCAPLEETCDCACLDYITSQGSSWIPINWAGPWNNLTVYGIWDIVSYGDANTEDCCWLCNCDLIQNTGGLYDCNSSPPDDGDYPDGSPNCWVSCERTPSYPPSNPSPVIGDPCGPCEGPSSAQTYECTTSGCVMSNCVYNPPGGVNVSIWQTQNNCYTASTCGTQLVGIGNDQCRADCYCADPGPPAGLEPSEVSNCTVLQDYLNDIYSVGTGNLGIYFMGYSPYPYTYPPVASGIVHQTTGSFFWPYDSLDTCQTQLSTGLFDCCSGGTGTTTWECDHSCNCPTVNGNPCVGGVGCYPVYGTGGTFTSLSACQEWCTWECNTNGAQICQFVPMSTAPTTYPSATACEAANTNCQCNYQVEEWWCDWAGADAGIYDTPGSQPCQPSSFFIGQGNAYQSQAIGQGVGGPSDPNNNYYWAVAQGNLPTGQGFPTLQQCQEMCRFCCDCAPPGTGECELCGNPTTTHCNWGDWTCLGGTQSCGSGLPSSESPGDCAQQQLVSTGEIRCEEQFTEYCCHAVDGCLSYIGAAPIGSDGNPCVTFYGTNAAACTNECNFVCGDCVPPDGACHCEFVLAPISPTCSPYPFSNMQDCNNYVGTLNLLGDSGSCCKCYDCMTNSPITYQAWDNVNGGWITLSTPVTMTTGALPWVPGQVYNVGDVVTFFADGTECCYVIVYGHYDPNTPPNFYYQAYVNDIANNTPVWPGGGTGSLVWIPCDTSCPPGVNITTYDCIQGTIYDSCDSLTQVNPPTTLMDTYEVLEFIANPSGMPYLQTTNITTIKFPYGGFGVSLVNPCLHNGLPLATAGGNISISSFSAAALGISQGYNSWISLINAVNGAGLYNISGPNTGSLVSSADEFMDVCTAVAAAGGHHSAGTEVFKCMTLTLDACECTQDPCHCQMVTGPSGTFNNIGDCQALLNNNPCCGTWKCDRVACDCVFTPNDPTGYPTQLDCYNDKNCCEIRYPEYVCDRVPILGPIWANNFRCDCKEVPAGTGTYTGPNALFDCENDPTTCCSGTPQEIRWKCNSDCNCVIDQFGPHATLHDCQTFVNNNCCYTGKTQGWDCVTFDDGTCDCVLVNNGAHATKQLCEAQVNTCCYTGDTTYNCIPGTNGLCKCVAAGAFGQYTSLFNCQNSIPGPTNCCEVQSGDCRDDCSQGTIHPTLIKHNGVYNIGGTLTYSLASTNILGVWLSGTFYNMMDTVKDPLDDCCYVLVCDNCHFAGSDIMNFPPSQIYQNHLLGLFYNGTTVAGNPPPQSTEINNQNRGAIWWPCDPDCPIPTPDTGYDCINCPGFCNCVPNNTGTAMYQGPMALSDCLKDCQWGCEDCISNLAGYLTGPMDYEGTWTSTFVGGFYNINDCVTDPADGCCYCCVEDNIIHTPCSPTTPPQPCPIGQVWQGYPICACSTPHVHAKDGTHILTHHTDDGPGGSGPGSSGPIGCKSSFQPSLNLGVNIGGGAKWMDCKTQTNGDPCTGNPDPVDCSNCDNYMATNWGATLPLKWKTPAMQHYDDNMCIHDPVDGCCYCCVASPTGDPTVFGENWALDPHSPNLQKCSVYDTNGDGILEYYGAQWHTGQYFGWVSCSPTGAFPCSNASGATKYACANTPIFGNPGNMSCVPDPTGPYTTLAQCQNSPCPPAPQPCKQCCGKAGGSSYQQLPINANPCDCATWLGIGWIPVAPSNCCVPHHCPDGQVWSQSQCQCVPDTIGPIDDDDILQEEPCVQTESCAADYYWDWVECKCVPNTEPCPPEKCKEGEVWNPVLCRCVKINTPTDTPVHIMS